MERVGVGQEISEEDRIDRLRNISGWLVKLDFPIKNGCFKICPIELEYNL